MKNKRKWILLALLVAGLLLWLLWPRSIGQILPADKDAVTGLSANGSVALLEDGEPVLAYYTLKDRELETGALDDLWPILAASGYRQDLRNLLPWNLEDINGGSDHDGSTVTLVLYTGTEEAPPVFIQFLSSSIMTVSENGGERFYIYHPTNPDTLPDLVRYLQTHGRRQ